jgi:tetratricopeptide (TPR) repeat protein
MIAVLLATPALGSEGPVAPPAAIVPDCDAPGERSEAIELFCRGMRRGDAGDPDGAIADLERALVLQPDLLAAQVPLGTAYYHAGQYERAIAAFDIAVAQLPPNYMVLANRSGAYLRSGNLVAARTDVDRALALSPNDPSLLENRIVIARLTGDFQTVIDDAGWLLDHFPPKATWLLDRGKALGAESRFDESLADLMRAVQMNPSADTHYFRGVTHYFMKSLQAALADFNQALTLDPDYEPAYLKRCSTYYQLQLYQAGLADCDEFVRRRPDAFDGYYTRGIVRSRAGDQEGALADYRRAIELAENPDEAVNAWYGVGLVNERAGRKKDAREAYRQTLSIDPEYRLALEALKRLGK